MPHGMGLAEAVEQLKSLRENQSFYVEEWCDDKDVFKKDVMALDIAIDRLETELNITKGGQND